MAKGVIFLGLLIIAISGGVILEDNRKNEPIPGKNMTAIFFDVGQGDSSLLILPEGEKILIDCGEDDRVLKYLSSMNITQIEILVITHDDRDHSKGCYHVENKLNVIEKIESEEDIDVAYNNYIIPTNIEIFMPYKGEAEHDNENSIIVYSKYGQISFLFTGDCERKCEWNFLDIGIIKADLLKVPHHGSRYSTSRRYIKSLNPSIAIISTGKNSFGHPHPYTISRLEEEGVDVYVTRDEGSIVVTSDGKTQSIYNLK